MPLVGSVSPVAYHAPVCLCDSPMMLTRSIVPPGLVLATLCGWMMFAPQGVRADDDDDCRCAPFPAQPWPAARFSTGDAEFHPGRPWAWPHSLPPVPPPPGTLGVTYLQPSHPVPNDRHPRTAIIGVYVPGNATVSVHGLEDFVRLASNDGVCWFESSRPLVPGVPHVYRVEAHIARDGESFREVRWVRMIPGRIVTLSF
ncbi:MAG: hypothetical protein KY476_22550 [Planctomycetes bacterium]|nr:hypothetical protein [Planctomycetota bacterium]